MDLLDHLRSYRLGPFAIFDFATSYAAVWCLAPSLQNYASREQLLWLTLPAAILVHAIVGRSTPLNRMVFGPDSDFLVQAVVVLMLGKGLKLV